VHPARRFATIPHLLGVISEQFSHQIPLKAAFERLCGTSLSASWATSRLSGFRQGPLFHASSGCLDKSFQHATTTALSDLVNEPVCHRCSWVEHTPQGKILSLAARWYTVIDAPQQAFAPTWRTAFLLHALANPSADELPPGNGSLMMPVRRLLVDRAQSAIDAAKNAQGVSTAHRHLAALALPIAVTPDRAREFAKWAANTAAFGSAIHYPEWDLELASIPRDTMKFVAVRSMPGPSWASSLLSAQELNAVCSFYPYVFCHELANGVVHGELPIASINGLIALGFNTVPALGHPLEVLEMAAQLYDPSGASDLSDLGTALKAAAAVIA
jgi:hypothetical protein